MRYSKSYIGAAILAVLSIPPLLHSVTARGSRPEIRDWNGAQLSSLSSGFGMRHVLAVQVSRFQRSGPLKSLRRCANADSSVLSRLWSYFSATTNAQSWCQPLGCTGHYMVNQYPECAPACNRPYLDWFSSDGTSNCYTCGYKQVMAYGCGSNCSDCNEESCDNPY